MLFSLDISLYTDSISQLFEEGPDKVTPGTKMPIQKMKNKKDRLDLVLYLKEATN